MKSPAKESRGTQRRTDAAVAACPSCKNTVRHFRVTSGAGTWECPSCGRLSTFRELELAERQINQRGITRGLMRR